MGINSLNSLTFYWTVFNNKNIICNLHTLLSNKYFHNYVIIVILLALKLSHTRESEFALFSHYSHYLTVFVMLSTEHGMNLSVNIEMRL